MTVPVSRLGDLTLRHVLAAAGVDPTDVVVLRHTYTTGGLETPADATPEKLLAYVRSQGIDNKLGRTPPRIWLNFMTDGGRRSRFVGAYENHGEVDTERTGTHRFFDLRPSDVLASLGDRLVIEWSRDAVNWAKRADRSDFAVVEIADPQVKVFPGFDEVLLSYADLQAVVDDARYAPWRIALGAVQGIYLITDAVTGKMYVGKADGAERILGRWTAYARDGHGGNVALKARADADIEKAATLQFSLLRVFGPSVPQAEVDAAESHFKRALLTRRFGLNLN